MGGIGDGGIITTNKQKNYKRIKLLRNYGHNKEGITILNGRNSRLDTIQAIILNQRLKKLNSENLKRIKIAKMYDIKLKKLPIKLPLLKQNLSNVFHLYVIRVNQNIRDKLVKFLKTKKL